MSNFLFNIDGELKQKAMALASIKNRKLGPFICVLLQDAVDKHEKKNGRLKTEGDAKKGKK